MRALAAALLLLVALLPGSNGDSEGDEDDSESDTAPFMIVVEHRLQPAWHCSGSLVSMRTGVTSAACARGPAAAPAQHELWALAAATAAGLVPRGDGARRVSRLATAGTAAQTGPEAEDERYSGYSAKHDLAVLELASPFGSAARARPILMATSPQECTDSDVCHVVRAAWRGAAAGGGVAGAGVRRARLRIVDATLAPEAACVTAVHQWMSLRERALCLTGPELCTGERGAGVVCGGKLCGVVSRSGPQRAPQHSACGAVHAAQSVARWRRFLHCAHTLRACGRGACAELCSERRLQPDEEAEGEEEGDSGEAGAGGGGGGGAGGGRSPPPRSPRPASPSHSVPPPQPPMPLSLDSADEQVTKYKVKQKPTRVSQASQAASVASEVGQAGPGAGVAGAGAGTQRDDKPSPWTGIGEWDVENELANVAAQDGLGGGGAVAGGAVPALRKGEVALRKGEAGLRGDPLVPRRTTPLSAPLMPPAAPAPPAQPAPPVYIAGSSESADSAESGENNDVVAKVPTPTAAPPPAATGPPAAPRRLPPPPPGAPRAAPPAPSAPDVFRPGAGAPFTSPVSIRPTPLFEPNRPDFRAGEYGDNAAEYGAPDDGGGGGGGSGGGGAGAAGGGGGGEAPVPVPRPTPPRAYGGPGTPRLASPRRSFSPATEPPEPEAAANATAGQRAPPNQRPPAPHPPLAFARDHGQHALRPTSERSLPPGSFSPQGAAITTPTLHLTTYLFFVLLTLFL